MNLNKVIIWGHQLHNHTHSYIHNAFYIGFKYLGYKVYWFNENGENNYPNPNEEVDFNNSLYIVHGLESKNLPLNNTSFYIGHNVEWIYNNDCKIPKLHALINNTEGIPSNNIMSLQVYCIGCLREKKYNDYKYYCYSDDYNIIYMPWATDLLPYEIDENIKNLDSFQIKNISNFIGMPLEHWGVYCEELKKYNIEYKNYGGTFDVNSKRNKSIEENMKLIQESIIAPALQTQWQVDNHYIPCRIFKNISYGKMGITNNLTVYELFEKKIIYSDSIEKLVNESLEFNNKSDKNKIIKDLMIEVRDNHTYLNRINFVLDFIKINKNINITKN
jgi:hypothetical protein